jgi:uncharacterized protein (DUF1330 family)
MAFIEPEAGQIQAFMSMGVEGPIQMLNLLKFKSDGGRERYMEYSAQALPLVTQRGGRVVYRAEGKAAIIGPEVWDAVLIVEYPERAAFLDMVQSAEYQACAHIRTEAVADSRLVCMQPA